MVSCSWETRTADDVALVAGCCRAVGRVDREVTLEPAGPGPVWPPRRDPPGVGWVGGRATLRVPVGGSVPVGFATTVPVPEPPVAVVRDEPAGDGGVGTPTIDPAGRRPEAITRSLPTPAPPADAVPDTFDRQPPAAVREWLEDVERRLSGRESERTIDGVGYELPTDRVTLERQLSTVAERAGTLAQAAADRERERPPTDSGPSGPSGSSGPSGATRR